MPGRSLPRLLADARAEGRRLAMVSIYDAPTAALCCEAGVDMILVGDSLGNVILGYESTIPVTMQDMLRHTGAVVRGVAGSPRPDVPVVADLPFGSYATLESATENGAALVQAGAQAVKLEGADRAALEGIRALVGMGVPVVGHLGFTPQSSLSFGSVVQGKSAEAARRLLEDARAVEEAGCCAVVLEAVPSEVARRITEELSISTIGIGAGAACDAQVLVWHDLVGLSAEPPLRFVRRYAEVREVLQRATGEFVAEVRSGAFPAPEHGWNLDEEERRRWEQG